MTKPCVCAVIAAEAEVISGPIVGAHTAPDLKSDVGPIAEAAQAGAVIRAGVNAIVSPGAIDDAAESLVTDEGVHATRGTVVAVGARAVGIAVLNRPVAIGLIVIEAGVWTAPVPRSGIVAD